MRSRRQTEGWRARRGWISRVAEERSHSPVAITKRERFTLLAVRRVFDAFKRSRSLANWIVARAQFAGGRLTAITGSTGEVQVDHPSAYEAQCAQARSVAKVHARGDGRAGRPRPRAAAAPPQSAGVGV
jgi:hypothetical protein